MSPAHSKLGASSAERWMNCPGSVALIESLGPADESNEPEWTKEGTAAHEILAIALRSNTDAWEHTTDESTATAVQLGIDTCRSLITPHGTTYIEHRLSSGIHPDYGGTVDFAHVADSLLNVVDYKHGVGLPVEVDHNPQTMYYAYGVLELHPMVERVVIRVVQPRCEHPAGPVRRFVISAEELRAWVKTKLVPAMERTAIDNSLDDGPHCRFCPAKLVCPLMKSLYGAAMTADPDEVVNMTDEVLAKAFAHTESVRMYLRALTNEVAQRVVAGRSIPSAKLVNKKSDRVYKDGAVAVFTELLGDRAYDTSMKSPAQMEKVSPEAKTLVREWAYQPMTGYTVVPVTDKRRAVQIERSSDVFQTAIQNLASGED